MTRSTVLTLVALSTGALLAVAVSGATTGGPRIIAGLIAVSGWALATGTALTGLCARAWDENGRKDDESRHVEVPAPGSGRRRAVAEERPRTPAADPYPALADRPVDEAAQAPAPARSVADMAEERQALAEKEYLPPPKASERIDPYYLPAAPAAEDLSTFDAKAIADAYPQHAEDLHAHSLYWTPAAP